MYVIKYVQNGVEYNTLHDPNPMDTKDIPNKEVYYYSYVMPMDIIYTNDVEKPTVLYYKNDENEFENYSGDEWTIFEDKIYKLGQLATYTGETVETKSPDLTSYIINANGVPTDFINSNVGLISIIKEALTDENAKIMALNLCATLGRNPYLGGF